MRSHASLLFASWIICFFSAPSAAMAEVATSGALPTLVVDVNLDDQPRVHDLASIYEQAFGDGDSFNTWLLTTSRGEAWLEGDVISMHLPDLESPRRGSGENEMMRTMIRAVSSQMSLASYDRILFTGADFGKPTATWWYVDGETPSDDRQRIRASNAGIVVDEAGVHEFGHTLALGHSQGINCLDEPVGSNCRKEAYGGRYDVMGSGAYNSYTIIRDFNAIHQEILGWMSVEAGDGQEVQTTGSYVLRPLESADEHRYLRIPDQNPSSDQAYYLECRPPMSLHPNPEDDCVVVLYLRNNDISYMVDADLSNNAFPEDPVEAFFFIPPRDPLAEGAISDDSVRGIRISHQGMVDGEAHLYVELFEPQEDMPPAISLLSHEPGAEVWGSEVLLELEVLDDRSLVSVVSESLHTVRVDNSKIPGAYSFEFDSTQFSDGLHSVQFRATDSSGQVTRLEVPLNIGNLARDTQAPRIRIVSPSSGFIAPDEIWSHPGGGTTSITRIQFDVEDDSLNLPAGNVDVGFTIKLLPDGPTWTSTQPIHQSSGWEWQGNFLGSVFIEVEDDYDGTHLWSRLAAHRAGMDYRYGLDEGNYEIRGFGVDVAGNVGWSEPIVIGLLTSFDDPVYTSPSEFIRGDANGDNEVNMTDATAILAYLFLGQPLPEGVCRDAADVDDNGKLEVSDAVALLDFLYKGARPPAPPFPLATSDPTSDAITCEAP